MHGGKLHPRREEGQGIVEYALLIACGAVLVIGSMLFLADGVDSVFRQVGTRTSVFRPPVPHCDGSYDGACVPPAPPDLDCDDLQALGVPLPVRVVGGDPHGLDPDSDGLGCN